MPVSIKNKKTQGLYALKKMGFNNVVKEYNENKKQDIESITSRTKSISGAKLMECIMIIDKKTDMLLYD
jgi:hypothetical protein